MAKLELIREAYPLRSLLEHKTFEHKKERPGSKAHIEASMTKSFEGKRMDELLKQEGATFTERDRFSSNKILNFIENSKSNLLEAMDSLDLKQGD
eukprot:CAMPEP_0185576764 /NCGR_PEP_ID=MMETSP0434-20130131/7624_1 /TAXON_ID=626734 ORGANISM="Favella taraikaensis, Strain Fe Narragansett Bay" /NCGR_SAMPLE_ID=MMETSP0434 /ASSEMBLY_ACC=CAM_ASM_000379 /LENGTH=94 /DNA_ID=CAMNT_0028194097 /DNA_START=2156 /DNA_END=2440 /DNA_ORIENTATION=+